jgi:hypothetical protein
MNASVGDLQNAIGLLCRAIHSANINRGSKELADAAADLVDARRSTTSPPASPMSLEQSMGLDGLCRWHLRVSAPLLKSHRFELPQDFDPRLEQEPSGRFVLVLAPQCFPEPPSRGTQECQEVLGPA